MKRILYILPILSVSAKAQSYYDYMDDNAITGGIDSALNIFVVLLFLAVAFIVITTISGIIYGFNQQEEIDKQKREKAERDRLEKNKIEQKREEERQKVLLALPDNTIRLNIEGKPHFVGLSDAYAPTMITTCLWSINKIVENDIDITQKVGYSQRDIGYIYGKYYKSQDSMRSFGKLRLNKHCIELANKSNIDTFEVELTIKGDFEPQKLKIIHHIFLPSLFNRDKRDIFFLEYVIYDGDVIQTHLTNGYSITFPRPKDFPLL